MGPGLNEVEPGPVGGRLREFAGAWGDITSDKWVLQTVSSGYRIEFTESCRLTRAPLWTIIPAKHKHRVALEEGLHKMLLKKAIVQLDPSTIGPGFYSSLFLVEKRSGGWRPILNLKRLNEGLKPPKFRMDTLQSVLNTLGADIKLYRDRHRGVRPVGCFLGFAGRLLSRSCRSKGHEVPPLRLRRRDLRVSGPAVRPVDCSQNLHASGPSSRSLSQDAGNKCFPVSRRLVSGRRDLPVGLTLPGHSPSGNSKGGLRAQRGEIGLGSVPISSVSGVFARLGPPPGVSVGGSDRPATATHSSCSEVSGEPGETLEIVVWPPGQHDSAGPRGPAAYSSPPVLRAGEMGHVHAGVHSGVLDSGCQGDTSMVAPYAEPHVRGSFLGPGPGDDDSHRRLVLRVGRSPGRPDSFWHLATTREVEAHKLARASGGLAHVAAFPAATEQHSGRGTVGQHDDSGLYQQTGRNSLSVAVQTSPGLVGVVQRAPDRHIGGASWGREQHPGRCAVEGQLLPDGVDPPQVDVRVPVAGLGASVRGHVRFGEECPAPGILLPGSGSPGQRVERDDDELGYGSRLCVLSDRTDPADTEENSQTPVGDDRPASTVLAQPDLVQTDDQSPGRSAQGNTGSVEPAEELGDT